MAYELFFFKENNRYIDLNEMISYFKKTPYFKQIISEDIVEFRYINEHISLNFSLYLTKNSRVPDIYRLDPKYLDLDMSVQLSPLLSNFKLNVVCDFIFDFCQKFNFAIYNILFKDVSLFNKELIYESYMLYRDSYREKNPLMFNNLNFLNKEKLNNLQAYLYERGNLENYYKDKNIIFPELEFLKSKTNQKIYVAQDFVFDNLYAFVCDADILFYKDGGYLRALYLDEVLSILGHNLVELPGFGKKILILKESGVRKIKKLINRADLTEVCDTFDKVEQANIVDFK